MRPNYLRGVSREVEARASAERLGIFTLQKKDRKLPETHKEASLAHGDAACLCPALCWALGVQGWGGHSTQKLVVRGRQHKSKGGARVLHSNSYEAHQGCREDSDRTSWRRGCLG